MSINKKSALGPWKALLLMISVLVLPRLVMAQATLGYRQTTLACRIQCDPPRNPVVLNNPWGIAFLPGQSFLIAEHDAGRVDSYDATGIVGSGLSIPLPAGSAATISAPTGIVADPQARFSIGPARFQFFVATEEGTIVGFNIVNGQYQDARIVVDHSSTAVYTGLTLLEPNCCAPVLAAANFHEGQIELFGLSRTAYPGAFQDPNLPAGYSPYNIQAIGNFVFVTYAKKNETGRAPLVGAGLGIVSIFDLEGNFVRRFLSDGGPLNVPWGVTLTSANFGPFPGKILIGNTGGDGTILVFDPADASSLGPLTDSEGFVIINPGVHGLVFRGDRVSDGIGDPDTLYYSAASLTGLRNDGLFAAVQVGRLTATRVLVPNPVGVGVLTNLTADVHPLSGGDTATGTVEFFDNFVSIGRGTLAGGIANLPYTFTSAGTHSVLAVYQGTDNLLESFDLKQFVIGPATTTTLTGPTAAVLGRPVTFSVRTVSDDGRTVTGGITFLQNGNLVVVVPLSGQGTVSSDFIFSQPGTYSIVASYSGSDFQPSTSAPLQISVSSGDFQFTSTASSLTVPAGHSADLTVTVAPTEGFSGSVSFACVAPNGITCSFNPGSINVNGAPATARLTVSAASLTARSSHGLGFTFVTVGVFGTFLMARSAGSKKRAWTLIVLLAIAASLSACGGAGTQNGGTPPGTPQTFSVTLNATSASVTHSTNISVVVQ